MSRMSFQLLRTDGAARLRRNGRQGRRVVTVGVEQPLRGVQQFLPGLRLALRPSQYLPSRHHVLRILHPTNLDTSAIQITSQLMGTFSANRRPSDNIAIPI